MTQVSLNVNGPTAGNITVAYEMSDADGARIIMAYGKIYGPVDDGNGGMRPMTPTEIVDKLGQGLISGVIANVKRLEQSEAAEAAAAAVTDIVVTPQGGAP